MKATFSKLLLAGALSVFISAPLAAHEGEDHGAPEVAAPPQAAGQLPPAASARGAEFEAVIKHLPLVSGREYPITVYLLDSSTNEPVEGAAMKGTLSSGELSQEVTFSEIAGGLAGDYQAVVKPSGAGPWSWLLDVTAGEKVDLIGVSAPSAAIAKGGEDGAPSGAVASTSSGDHDHGGGSLAIIAAAVVALIAGTLLGRGTARSVKA